MAAPLFARAALRRGLPSLAPGAVGGVRSVTSKLFLAGELAILETCLYNWIRIELLGRYDPHNTRCPSVCGLWQGFPTRQQNMTSRTSSQNMAMLCTVSGLPLVCPYVLCVSTEAIGDTLTTTCVLIFTARVIRPAYKERATYGFVTFEKIDSALMAYEELEIRVRALIWTSSCVSSCAMYEYGGL